MSPSPDGPLVEVENLSKLYGSFAALSELTFAIEPGRVVGLLGVNGAGKTTTLRILAGVMGPSRGRVRLGGFDILDQPIQARRQLGYLPEAAPLYPEMLVREYLEFRAELRETDRSKRATAVKSVMADAGCTEVAQVLIGELSRGYRQRVGLADALLGSPPILLLDEPTAGLDPNEVRELRRLLADLGTHRTLLVSTHLLSEVDAICTHVLVLDHGSLIANSRVADLKARQEAPSLLVRLVDAQGRGLEALNEAGLAAELASARDAEDATYRITCNSGEQLDAVAERASQVLHSRGLALRELSRRSTSLEDIFARLTLPGKD